MGPSTSWATWREGAEHYLALYAKIHLAPASRRRMEIVLNQFGTHLAASGITRLVDVSRGHIETYQLARVEAKKSPATVNADVRHLRAFLRRAALDGWIPVDPSVGVKLLRVPKRHSTTRAPEEIAKIIAELRKTGRRFWADLVILVVNTGLRLGEALALRTNDVRDCKLHIRIEDGFMPKDREERIVPLNPAALEVISRRLLAVGRKDLALLWPSRKGKLMDQNWARRKLYEAAEDAGVPHTTWQSLRRTFASVTAGKLPELALMALCGWSDPRTAKQHYIRNLLMDLPPPPEVVST